MASVTHNEFGIVIMFEHDEIERILTGAAGIAAGVGGVLGPALVAAHVAAPIIAVIEAGVAAYFAAEILLIRQTDIGFGVYLTIPWPAVLYGQWWLIIPTSRPEPIPPPPPLWSNVDNGTFGTNDPADSISYRIERGAIGAEAVTFRLVIGPDSSGWAKVIVMPDGEGNEWEIKAEGRNRWAENSLWANQVLNGQALRFMKPRTLGIWSTVLELGDLAGLNGGDRVVFTWERDT